MKKTVLGLAVLTAMIIAGCSKKDSGDPITDAILGKWTPVSIQTVIIDRQNNTSKTTNTTVYPGDYWDFRKDGKVYRYETNPNEGPGYDPHDTLDYKWHNPNWIIDGEVYWIHTTGSKDSLILAHQEDTPNQFWETTYTFKK